MADIKPGDVVLASGVDGIYPKGFPIGRVESSERGSGLYRSDHRASVGGLLESRGSARRARAAQVGGSGRFGSCARGDGRNGR